MNKEYFLAARVCYLKLSDLPVSSTCFWIFVILGDLFVWFNGFENVRVKNAHFFVVANMGKMCHWPMSVQTKFLYLFLEHFKKIL